MPLAAQALSMPTAPGQVRLDDLLRVCSSEGRINTDLLQELLHLFINENDRRARNAVTAADEGNTSTFQCEVHAMKGSAALIGAEYLRDLAGELEVRIASGTVRNPAAAARQLRDELDAVVATLRGLYPDLCAD